MKITILGCGSSGGVPLISAKKRGFWGNCNPNNIKNKRSRSSLLIAANGKNIIVDTSPDFKQQVLPLGLSHLDAILFTHIHADHVHGIDEVRPFYFFMNKGPIPIYGDSDTINQIEASFSYLFTNKVSAENEKLYPTILKSFIVKDTFYINDLKFIPFIQNHGFSYSLGYRLDNFAYSTDVVGLDDSAFDVLEGIDVWIVDCTGYLPRPTHSHLDLTLSWIKKIKPKKAFLTHMNYELDYDELRKKLPNNIEPAYDGMIINV